jgi:hypothetical protein
MFRNSIFFIFIFNFALNVMPQESGIKPDNEELSVFEEEAVSVEKIPNQPDIYARKYSINISWRICDKSDNILLSSKWSRVTLSGKPISVNLRAKNLVIATTFIPYYIDDKSVMLFVQGKTILKPVNYTDGRYYSTVNSLPLKIGEKALFFPLGVLQGNENMENISSCILEIEVHHYGKIKEKYDKENIAIDPLPEQSNKRNKTSNEN